MAINEVLSGQACNVQVLAPLSEMLMLSGFTMVLLGVLYRQLPIDLIPDCIPCIGSYDDMVAGMVALLGALVCGVGVYLQLLHVDSPNSTLSLLHQARQFAHSKDEHKWVALRDNAQYLVQRGATMLKQSAEFIYGQVNRQMQAG